MPAAPGERMVFTIGHSTHSIERFAGLLQQHGVTAVADVRSAPYSRFNPQFNREALERALKQRDIGYAFLGKELGARSEDPACYEAGKVQYRRLAQTALFKSGIERVHAGAQKHRLALMCAEKDPLNCHRTLLVSRALENAGIAVRHVLADGRVESQAQAMQRLVSVVGLPETDLFRSPEELVASACALQEGRVAYTDEGV